MLNWVKKRRLTLNILIVITLIVTGCSKNQEAVSMDVEALDVRETVNQEPKYGGWYEAYIESDLRTLDPAFATAALDGQMISLLYDALVGFDTGGKVIPSLAQSWEFVDEKTIIFQLVDHASFHNGKPFTAEDVKYSFERVLDPKVGSPRTWVFEKLHGAQEFMDGEVTEVRGIEVINDYEIKLILEEPFAPFLAMLGMPAAHIVNREEVEKYSNIKDYSFNPVGTGPYIMMEYRTEDRLILKANEAHYAGRPYLDGINYRVIKDGSTAVAEFEAGNLDVLAISSAELERFRNHPSYRPYITSHNTLWNYYIGLTSNKPPFDDQRVRQAFNYAVDRRGIIDAVRPETAVVSHGPIPPGIEGFREGLDVYPYNPEKARKLLEVAGYSKENPAEIELYYINAISNVVTLEPVQAMLNEVGFDTKLISMEANAYQAAVRSGVPNAFYMAWGADYPDAENYLYPLFHSTMYGGGGNETRYDNPRVDELLAKAHQTLDHEERISLYQEIEDIVVEDAARMWFFTSRSWYVHKPEVQGIEVHRIFSADKKLTLWLDR